MPKYNLDSLGHQEFEHLCQSLIQQIIGPGAKIYGAGSDGAREATFQGRAPYPSVKQQWDGQWIFQAKFHDVQQIGPKEARRRVLIDLEEELRKITEKYKHPCDNYILMTNVSLSPAFQSGVKDKIDTRIIPKFQKAIKNIHVWGAEELSCFLDAHPTIRKAYAHLLVPSDVIARLLGLIEKEESDIDEIVRLYCCACYNHEKSAALDDAGDVDDKPVDLQRIFIDLEVKSSPLPKEIQLLEPLPTWLKQAWDEERVSALSYLLDDSVRYIVIVGGPGKGKSTLGQYIAQIHRARLIGKVNDFSQHVAEIQSCIVRIPFRILLKEYAQWISSQSESDSLFHYIATTVTQECTKKVSAEDIHRIVKTNPVLLILDGLDEVSEKKLRARVLSNINSFAAQVVDVFKGDLRIVATTRPYGYSEEFDPRHYLHLSLDNLSEKKTLEYARLWTIAREPNPKDRDRISTTFQACLKDRVVGVLTQTPLQVTILLVIIRAGGTPPKQREELFERYMDIIYQREIKRRPELLTTDRELIYGLHKFIAYVLHKRAEKDITAALMDISEFKQKVQEYLAHTAPLLEGEQLERKMNQIIAEASQRLVLIESPQAGKIGFGLTTIREFFAAAHLVDTAKDTRERDLRFRAIATHPHWRNVALFFAGRVGRTLPGEAPSMIDVCRLIDTDRADRYLKRGAKLVAEIVDDRDLREPYNEIGALQYCLTLLDSSSVENRTNFVMMLRSLPDNYKERVVRPWIEERIDKVLPENLETYIEYYNDLFGITKQSQAAIHRAAKCGSKKVKLWALSMASKNRVQELWVLKLLEELVAVLPVEELSKAIEDYWPSFQYFLGFPLSEKARITIAVSLLSKIERRHSPPSQSERVESEILNELSRLKKLNKWNENHLYVYAVLLLSLASITDGRMNLPFEGVLHFEFPGIINPSVKGAISSNTACFEDFCAKFSNEKEHFTIFLVKLLSFLLAPADSEKYVSISNEILNNAQTLPSILQGIFFSFLGCLSNSESKLCSCHGSLFSLYNYFKSEKQYKDDLQELSKIVNQESNNIQSHPYRLFVWFVYDQPCEIKKYLDRRIIGELTTWFEQRNSSENALCLPRWSISTFRPESRMKEHPFPIRDFVKFVLEVAEEQIRVSGQFAVWPIHIMREFYKEELVVAKQLTRILEEVLARYPSMKDPGHAQLDALYWSFLNCPTVIKEKHMSEFYKIFHNDSNLPRSSWNAEARIVLPTLYRMLKNENLEVARLAGVSLSERLQYEEKLHEETKLQTMPSWIGDKLWKLAENKKDIWRHRYLKGMTKCNLPWFKKKKEWLQEMKDAKDDEIGSVWGQILLSGKYRQEPDRNALLDLLADILESRDLFPKSISSLALERLRRIIPEVEQIGFSEEELNLPLSKRPNLFLP
jgi:nucleoside-triphosphatase THEP1